MEIFKLTEKGKGKEVNEDVIYTRVAENGFCFVGIADGQSHKMYCREGAKAALITVADCLQKYSLSNSEPSFHERIRLEIGDVIKQNISTLAEIFETDKEQFASTLVCVAFNINADSIVTVHLGDGRIASLSEESRFQTISCPENGITNNHTWLTTNPLMLSHIRVCAGKLQENKGLLLLTDGTEEVYQKLEEEYCEETATNCLNRTYFEKLFHDSNLEDDATMVFVRF